ncbi:carboxypeptidase-like regulatory domain-containing protein [Salicola sp. Rm-C-2C1-2]|uniref:carboxypeptidase-like regulatory domain-containing protein n=1 Tax=Salicola sp. Rm-C-2C1-2 TaxID=3141321 RepID=UPI0032E4A9E6
MFGKKKPFLVSSLSMVIGVTGCIDSSSDNNEPGGPGDETSNQAITGTAAQGAPLRDATVTVRCVNDDTDETLTAVTNDAGVFKTDDVAESYFPCGLKADDPDSEQTFYSFAQEPGQANITPYTDMVIAVGASKDPVQWFENLKRDGFVMDQARIDNAMKVLNEGLKALGLPVDGKNPMKTEFEIGDDYDLSMDRFMAGVSSTSNLGGYEALRPLLKDGNVLEGVIDNVPEQAPDQDDNNDTAQGYAQCWNEDYFRSAHTSELEFEVTNDSGTYTNTVKRSVEERSGNEIAMTIDTVPKDSTRARVKQTHILNINYSGKKTNLKQLTTTTFTDQGDITTTYDYDPAFTEDLSKDSGESTTNTYTQTLDGDPDSAFEVNTEYTFTGVRTISIEGLGEIEACRVEKEISGENSNTSGVFWVGKGNGIVVRDEVEGGTTEELRGGTFIGEDVANVF